MSRRLWIAVGRVLLVAGLFLFWEAGADGFGLKWSLIDERFFSRPSLIAADIAEYASSGALTDDLQATLTAAMLGLVLGVAGGLVVGLVLGYLPTFAAIVEPVAIALNSLPRISLAPVLVLWFGIGMTSKVAVSLFTVFFVILWNTLQGVRSTDPDLVKVVKVMGGSRLDVARMVVIPSVLGWVFAALRTSVSFAITGALVAEFVGSTRGLGYRLNLAVGLLNTDRVFAIALVLMVVATTLVLLSAALERYLLRWRGSVQL